AKSVRSRESAPMALSSALCRPTSSRTTLIPSPGTTQAAACTLPVRALIGWRPESSAIAACSAALVTLTPSRTGPHSRIASPAATRSVVWASAPPDQRSISTSALTEAGAGCAFIPRSGGRAIGLALARRKRRGAFGLGALLPGFPLVHQHHFHRGHLVLGAVG